MIPWRMVPSLARSPTHGKPEKLLEKVGDRMRCATTASERMCRYSEGIVRFIRFDSFRPAHPASLPSSSDLAVPLAPRLGSLQDDLGTRDRLDVNASFT